MVFGTFRIYGYRLCFAVRGFRKRCSRARFRDSFAACFAVRGFRACVLLFEAFGSDVPKARFREAQKIVFVDSKGNVKEFFGSGFGPFSARVQMVFRTFRIYGYRLCFVVRGFRKRCSKARFRDRVFWIGFWPFSARIPDGVWDFSLLRLPLVFCCSRLSGLCFAVRGFRKRCPGQISGGP